MSYEYVNFGYPDTILPLLTGFNLEELSPINGIITAIIIDSPSEFVGIRCLIDQIQILPVEGEITIRTSIKYPISRSVNMESRLVVALDNHDPLNPHTPSIVWEIKRAILSEIGGVI